jgi:hypothetical protein
MWTLNLLQNIGLKSLSRLVLILVAIILVSMISIVTRNNAHPDEHVHIDAFHYFEDNWWPPDLGSDKVIYSRYGWSRVYTGEIVYIIYGKLGKIIKSLFNQEADFYIIYRFLNVSLFLLTLISLFYVRCRWIDPKLIGLTFICIPQVHYIYSYANSDAWGLSLSVFLFLLVAIMMDRPLRSWSWGMFILLGIFTGLVLASKLPYLLSLFLPYSLIVSRVIHEVRRNKFNQVKWMGNRLIVAGLLAIAVMFPLKIIYPITQSNFNSSIERMRENKALDGYKPSKPTYKDYRLSSKEKTYFYLLTKKLWISKSLKSFYGAFGYMNVWNPEWIYFMAGLIFLIGIYFTVYWTVLNWGTLSNELRVCLIFSPIIIATNIYASIYHSLHVDYQPQGRYLFASLIPISLIWMGTMHVEKEKLKKFIRVIMFVIMYLISIFSLTFVVLTNHSLQ